MNISFDTFDLLDLGSKLKGRIAQASGFAALALLWGWSKEWPIAYPLVQGALDARAARMLEMYAAFGLGA